MANARNFSRNNNPISTQSDYNLAVEQATNILEFITSQKEKQNELEKHINTLLEQQNNSGKLDEELEYARNNKMLSLDIIKGLNLDKIQTKIDEYNAKERQAMEQQAQKKVNNNKEWQEMEEQAQREVNNNLNRGTKTLVYSTPDTVNNINNNDFYSNNSNRFLNNLYNTKPNTKPNTKKNLLALNKNLPLTKTNSRSKKTNKNNISLNSRILDQKQRIKEFNKIYYNNTSVMPYSTYRIQRNQLDKKLAEIIKYVNDSARNSKLRASMKALKAQN